MIKRYFKTLDYQLLTVIVILCGIGAVMVYSATTFIGDRDPNMTATSFFTSQLQAMGGGFLLFFIFSVIPFQLLRKRIFIIANTLISITLLIMVLFMGEEAGGARAWLRIGGFLFQPSEFVKIAVIVILAARYTLRQAIIDKFWIGVFPPLLYIMVIFGLIVMQNDLGQALTVLGITGFMIIGVGIATKKLLAVVGLGAVAAAVVGFLAFRFILGAHHLARFTIAYDPFPHFQGIGFQLISGYAAIANGGFWGRGLGNSLQKLGRLPGAHTDFIIAIISEELGFIGVAVILLCLGFIVFKGIIIAKKCPDTFGSLLAIGTSSYIAVQTFINVGGIIGLIPMTGIPLPFISFGGSAVAATLFNMGILMSVSRYTKHLELQRMSARKRQGQKPKLTVVQ